MSNVEDMMKEGKRAGGWAAAFFVIMLAMVLISDCTQRHATPVPSPSATATTR